MRAETIDIFADIRCLQLGIIAIPDLEDTVVDLGADAETVDLLAVLWVLHHLFKDDMIEDLLEIFVRLLLDKAERPISTLQILWILIDWLDTLAHHKEHST